MSGKEPRTPIWRQGGSGGRHPDAEPLWKKAPAATTVHRAPGRVLRLAIGLGALVLLAAAFGYVLISFFAFREPVAVLLVSGGPGTDLAVPHNAYGVHGLRRLEREWIQGAGGPAVASWTQAFFGRSSIRQLGGGALTLTSKDPFAWQEGLKDLNAKERTVLLFLGLHGAADARGPYLLLEDFNPAQSEPARRERGKLYLDAFFQQLAELQAGALKDKHVVVFLDATQITSSWPLGMLHNDFADRLEALDERISAVPNLVVISASGPGERSWPCEAWQETYFNHFVRVGLQGEAPHAARHKLTAAELFDYVSAEVANFVAETRGARQTPRIFPVKDGKQRAARICVTARLDAAAKDDSRHKVVDLDSSAWQAMEKSVVEEWRQHEALAAKQARGPSPFVHSPNAWREYQETLLRWEALQRAGLGAEDGAVADLQGRLVRLRTELARSQALEVGAGFTAALAIPRALGQPLPPGAEEDASAFLKRRDEAEFKEKKLEALAERLKNDRAYAAAFREAIYDHLAARARSGQVGTRELAAELQAIQIALPPLADGVPVEWNFAQVILEHASPQLPRDLLAKGLETRRLAERAAFALAPDARHPYAEIAARVVAPTVRAADALRLRGEDGLLATEEQELAQARKDLDDAARGYQNALVLATRVANVLEVRDRVLANLPALTAWKLAQPRTDAGTRRLEGPDVPALRLLWADAQELLWRAARLNTPDSLPELEKLADTVRGRYQKLEDEHGVAEDNFHALNSLSGWPGLAALVNHPTEKAEKRQALVRRFHAVSNQLITGKSQNPSLAPETPQADLLEAARREGRLAECILLDDPAGSAAVVELAIKALRDDALRTTAPEQATAASVSELGIKIQSAWRKLVAAARAHSLPAADADPEQVLATADRLSRLVDGGGASRLLDDAGEPLAPAREWRRWRMQDVFLAQTQRTLEHHWVAPDGRPHYQLIGRNLLADVESRTGLQPRVLRQPAPAVYEATRKLKTALEQPVRVAFQGPTSWTLTDEAVLNAASRDGTGVRFAYHLAKDARSPDVPLGAPAVSVLPAAPFEATPETPLDSSTAPRRQLLAFQSNRTDPMTCALTVQPIESGPRPGAKQHPLTVQGYYRGRSPRALAAENPLVLDVALTRLQAPNVVMRTHPQSQPAGVAVRADDELFRGFQQGAGNLVIVLDCSGSMWPDSNKEFTSKEQELQSLKRSRYGKAVRVIEDVLKELPAGTKVSIWVFSQKESENTPVERTIKRLPLGVMTWDPGRVREVVDKLFELRPLNQTPLLAAILKAYKNDIEPLPAQGFKTMLVITDGVDNRYLPNNPDSSPPFLRDIPTVDKRIVSLFKREETSRPFMPILVGFDVSDEKERKAIDGLGAVIKSELGGLYESVQLEGKEEQELAKLRRFLIDNLKKELRYQVRPASSSLPPEKGIRVDRPGGGDDYKRLADPGHYVVTVETERPDDPERIGVQVRPGELLNLELSGPPGKRTWRRVIYADDDPVLQQRKQIQTVGQTDWFLGVLQNKLKKVKDRQQLEMIVTLEARESLSPEAKELQMLNPRDHVWFEVEAQGSPDEKLPNDVTLHWHYLPGYPAPAYRVVLDGWTEEMGRPRLRLWWLRSQGEALPGQRQGLVEGGSLDTLEGQKPLSAFLKSVRPEKQWVRTRADDPRLELRDCLVVRMHYPIGEPTWVAPVGRDERLLGAEHRFYADAGEYVGVFWHDSGSTDWSLTGLQVVNRSGFKNKAGPLKMDVSREALMKPSPEDAPRPPQLLK